MDKRPAVFVIARSAEFLGRQGAHAALPLDLEGIAEAVALSPQWNDFPEAALVARKGPEPLLAILGYFDAEQASRLKALSGQLQHFARRGKHISYQQAESDCERLASRLLERFGEEEIRRFRFAPIPRGGFFVLGMLSYLLQLSPEQLTPPYPADVPLVFVDDCSLSGRRFLEFLKKWPGERAVFAHLYSPEGLRSAIEAKEAKASACVSARDLADHAPEMFGDGYAAWKELWLQRSGPDCYWVGRPDYVCFAWSEPEVKTWNPESQAVELGWRIVPPRLCLKNRPLRGTEAARVQFQPEGRGPLRPGASVVFGDLAGETIVANVETGETVSLNGVSARMWRSLVEHGTVEEAAVALRSEFDVAEGHLVRDLEAFVEELSAKGLLDRPHV